MTGKYLRLATPQPGEIRWHPRPGAGHPHSETKVQHDAEALAGVSTGRDPIISGPAVRIPAESYPWLVVEMRTDQPDRPQLFWRTTTASVRTVKEGDTSATATAATAGSMRTLTAGLTIDSQIIVEH